MRKILFIVLFVTITAHSQDENITPIGCLKIKNEKICLGDNYYELKNFKKLKYEMGESRVFETEKEKECAKAYLEERMYPYNYHLDEPKELGFLINYNPDDGKIIRIEFFQESKKKLENLFESLYQEYGEIHKKEHDSKGASLIYYRNQSDIMSDIRAYSDDENNRNIFWLYPN